MASLNFERHAHSHSSRLEPLPPHSSLYRAPPASQRLDSPPKKRMMTAQSTRYNSASSAALDEGLDPNAADFRNFFPYIPNEVKHRKRTSSDQAKVLEGVFDRNTKPDSSMRQRLAKELDMTPRGVQVWFQNRRAKEKLIGKKALAASETAYKKPPSPKQEPSMEQKPPSSSSRSIQSSSAASSSLESSPVRQARIPVPSELPSVSPWTASQSLSPEIPKCDIQQPGPPQAPADVYNRRPSLPTVIRHPTTVPSSGLSIPPGPVNLMARRGSVERLGGNPYARFLMSRVTTYHPRSTSLQESHDQPSAHGEISFDTAPPESFEARSSITTDMSRPMLGHRASMPHVFTGADMQRRASMPTDLQAISTFRVPDRHMFALSSRTVSAPIPGPLPTPNFSFGPPADSPVGSSSADNEGDYLDHIPELANFSFGPPADDNDTEDDVTSASYDAMSSRFGSIASVTGSESSNTSAYYSDVESCNELPEWNPEVRRGSYASSGQFLDLVSNLDLSHGGHEETIGPNIESGDSSDSGSAAYASPASTVSPGRSHGNSPLGKPVDVPMQALPISGSSELAHALQPAHERTQDRVQSGPSEAMVSINSAQYMVPNIYVHPSTEPGAVYPHADANLSSRSLPETAQKSYANPELNQFSNTDHYHNPNPYPPTSSMESHQHQSTTGSYSHYNGEILELHHAMEYQNSGFVSGAVDMSYVTSTVENILQPPEPYLQYP